jgi:hypothetical protein
MKVSPGRSLTESTAKGSSPARFPPDRQPAELFWKGPREADRRGSPSPPPLAPERERLSRGQGEDNRRQIPAPDPSRRGIHDEFYMSAIKSLGLFLPCGNHAPTPRHNKLTGASRDESVIVEDAKVCDGGGGSGRFDQGAWLGTLPYLPCLECRRETGAAHLRRRSQAPERSQTSFLQLNQIVYMRVCWMISPRLW